MSLLVEDQSVKSIKSIPIRKQYFEKVIDFYALTFQKAETFNFDTFSFGTLVLCEVIPNEFSNLLLLEGGSRGSEKMMMHIIIFSWSTSLLTSLLSVTK